MPWIKRYEERPSVPFRLAWEEKMTASKITLIQGDITEYKADAIVNAANSSLLGGGGVDGAIHHKGGPSILEECKVIRSGQGGCPAGEAVITTGGLLPCNHVIHTVGPIWRGGDQGEAKTLSNCYRNSLTLAATNNLKTVAFPSISTGVYGYPVSEAAGVAIRATKAFLKDNPSTLDLVTWVLFDSQTFYAYQEALNT
jgi:O-acetyl-ADP-ribose deacetylase (regulator of RNase III)